MISLKYYKRRGEGRPRDKPSVVTVRGVRAVERTGDRSDGKGEDPMILENAED